MLAIERQLVEDVKASARQLRIAQRRGPSDRVTVRLPAKFRHGLTAAGIAELDAAGITVTAPR